MRWPAFHALIARPEVTVGAISGHSMGAHRGDPCRRPPTRGSRRSSRPPPGRSVPAHPPDVPARPPAIPDPSPIRSRGSRRASTSARAATSSTTSAPRPPSRAPTVRSCSSTARDTVVPVGHLRRLVAPAVGARRRPVRRGVETMVVPGGQHSWLYEDAALPADPWPSFLTRGDGRSAGPGRGGGHRRRDACDRIPDGEAPVRAVEETLGRSARSHRSRSPAPHGAAPRASDATVTTAPQSLEP